MSDDVVIVSAARTPMGSFQGDFSSLAAHDLGGVAIRAAIERAGISPDIVEQTIFGSAWQAGVGPNPARLASVMGGVSVNAPANLM